MRHLGLGLLAASLALTIAGCDSSNDYSSDDEAPVVSTSEMRLGASFKANDAVFEADGTVEVTGSLCFPFYGGPTTARPCYLLRQGEALNACVAATCALMTRDPAIRQYNADLPYIAEAAYTMSFSRRDDVSAPNSVVTMPVPFTILAPPAGFPITDGQTVTVQWSPPNDSG